MVLVNPSSHTNSILCMLCPPGVWVKYMYCIMPINVRTREHFPSMMTLGMLWRHWAADWQVSINIKVNIVLFLIPHTYISLHVSQ